MVWIRFSDKFGHAIEAFLVANKTSSWLNGLEPFCGFLIVSSFQGQPREDKAEGVEDEAGHRVGG
jgi:hypothetical protein